MLVFAWENRQQIGETRLFRTGLIPQCGNTERAGGFRKDRLRKTMNERTKTGLNILLAGALLGLVGNILLRQKPWGLNAFLFVAAFAAALVLLTRKWRPELLTVTRVSLIGAMVFFASMFVVRDSIELRVYDTFAILLIMGVLMLGTFGVSARIAGVFHFASGFVWASLVSLFGSFFLLGSDIDWKSMPGTRLSRQVFSVLRGAAVALPLVLIFGALFSSADARFQALVNRVVYFEVDTLISHVVITSVLAWLSAGYLRGSVFTPGFAAPPETSDKGTDPARWTEGSNETPGSSYFEKAAAEPGTPGVSLPDSATVLEHINRSDPPDATKATDTPGYKRRDWQNIDSSSFPQVFTLGTIETVIILGLVDLLFLSFVIIQVPYLFGGMDLVQNTPDFKLAEYARRGFGELVAVAGLVLPMLLLSHWLLRRETRRIEGIFRLLAGIQIVLLFVIMASAAQRLLLLTGNLGYGLTTDRLYPMVFMVWLGIVFLWFALTVLRGTRQYFAWGALWSAFVVLAATHVLNPDEFVARTNIRLMREGRDFDGQYNARLSDDAIPTLLEALPAMSFEDQCAVKSRLSRRLVFARAESDLRTWSWPRQTALAAMEARREILTAGGCPGSVQWSGDNTED